MPQFNLHTDIEPLTATLARIFAYKGAAREVAVLANAQSEMVQTDYDNWNGGTWTLKLYLRVPYTIYAQLGNDREAIEHSIFIESDVLMGPYENDILGEVCIVPLMTADQGWQDKAKVWLSGAGITNQGRVRSDNIAPKSCDGLLFRSEPEINLYKAFKSLGVTFAPLPVFIQGGKQYQRIEPDFVVIKEGIVLLVEVDGDTVHHETPAEAHARTTMLVYEGAFLERVKASECGTPETAQSCARRLLTVIAKHKAAK